MQFLFSPLLGALSDRFGRRPVLLISMLGLGLDYILMALAPNLCLAVRWPHHFRHHRGQLLTAYAYIADVTPPEKRARRFGLVGAAFGVGFVLGPALGGSWAPMTRACRSGLRPASVWPTPPTASFRPAESLPPERRMAFSWARANPVGSLQLLEPASRTHGPRGRRVPVSSGARFASRHRRAVHHPIATVGIAR